MHKAFFRARSQLVAGLHRLWKTRGDPEVDKKFQKVQCTLVVTGRA